VAYETAGRTAAVGGLEGKQKTLHAKELGEGSRIASSDLGSLAVFNVEQVALNRHVSSQLQKHQPLFSHIGRLLSSSFVRCRQRLSGSALRQGEHSSTFDLWDFASTLQ
jgi:hypothetical protein